MAKKTRKELVALIISNELLPGVPTKWSVVQVQQWVEDNAPHLLEEAAPDAPVAIQESNDVPILEVVRKANEHYIASKMPECLAAACENKVEEITDEYCATCLPIIANSPHVICQNCKQAVPKAAAYKMFDGLDTTYICQTDCTTDIASQVRRETAKVENKPKAAPKSRSKQSTRSGPTKREQVLHYIADVNVFTVEDIASLLDTNMNNAATTVNLLITRPAANFGPIPFHRTAKGVYTRNGFEQPNPPVEAKDKAAIVDQVNPHGQTAYTPADEADLEETEIAGNSDCELTAPK